jgi:hypothetical protein
VIAGASSASPAATSAHAGHELVGGHGLEQEARGAGAQRLEDVGVLVEGGEDQHARLRRRQREDLAGRGQAVEARHADVHQHDVGAQARGERHRLVTVGGLAHHLEVGLGAQDHAKARAHELLVVGEHDLDHHATPSGRRARSAHPPSRRCPASRSPP